MSQLFPRYLLYHQETDTLLAVAKKRAANRSANYVISCDPKVERSGPGFVGKVRANFLGTEFMIYDGGERPDKIDKAGHNSLRKELGFV